MHACGDRQCQFVSPESRRSVQTGGSQRLEDSPSLGRCQQQHRTAHQEALEVQLANTIGPKRIQANKQNAESRELAL
eukprot:935478-Amphidinium_carterae.1